MRILPYGPLAVLVEFDSLTEVVMAAESWRLDPPPGVTEVVPAARTVLLVHDGSLDVDGLGASSSDERAWQMTSGQGGPRPSSHGEAVISVRYDGADLADVAASCRMSIDEVVRQHTSATYSVAFCGFMPGFAYLVGLPLALRMPRHPTPRTRVPAGSVAIADEYCGIYPRESPGGWHLLGTTGAVLWDEAREPPALLPPGTTVRFVAR
jgi:KipI family sensor histidine kinase inhibitor